MEKFFVILQKERSSLSNKPLVLASSMEYRGTSGQGEAQQQAKDWAAGNKLLRFYVAEVCWSVEQEIVKPPTPPLIVTDLCGTKS